MNRLHSRRNREGICPIRVACDARTVDSNGVPRAAHGAARSDHPRRTDPLTLFSLLIDGGSGLNTAGYAYATSGVTVDLDGDKDDGAPGELDTVGPNVQNIIGGAGPDTLSGNAGPNLIRGGKGKDALKGLAGKDTLVGGGGGDLLRSRRGGRDTDRCGAGNDTAVADLGDTRIGCGRP
jgi:Ca2+-binding RTX toxin-like protein